MRVNTQAVLDAFDSGLPLSRAEAIWTDGVHIWSYATCMVAQSARGILVLNDADYSVTTRIHQGGLLYWLLSGPGRWNGTKVRDVRRSALEWPRGVKPAEILASQGLKVAP